MLIHYFKQKMRSYIIKTVLYILLWKSQWWLCVFGNDCMKCNVEYMSVMVIWDAFWKFKECYLTCFLYSVCWSQESIEYKVFTNNHAYDRLMHSASSLFFCHYVHQD